jgi:hypothetical protein
MRISRSKIPETKSQTNSSIGFPRLPIFIFITIYNQIEINLKNKQTEKIKNNSIKQAPNGSTPAIRVLITGFMYQT